jgi:Domain of unknown function (DUF4265)
MTRELVKVLFELDPADWHGESGENLWAKPLADTEEVFEIENSPFFAKGVSYLDLVRAVERDGQYRFAGSVALSGHSTYRLIIGKHQEAFETWWKRLHELNCSFESGDFQGQRLLAVDVPASTDIFAVYKILEEGKKREIWLFEEGHVGHSLRGQG